MNIELDFTVFVLDTTSDQLEALRARARAIDCAEQGEYLPEYTPEQAFVVVFQHDGTDALHKYGVPGWAAKTPVEWDKTAWVSCAF